MLPTNLVADPISAARTKHLHILYHHVRQRVQMQQMIFYGVPTGENTEDLFSSRLLQLCLKSIEVSWVFIPAIRLRESMS